MGVIGVFHSVLSKAFATTWAGGRPGLARETLTPLWGRKGLPASSPRRVIQGRRVGAWRGRALWGIA